MRPNPERITWLTLIGWLVLALVIAMFATPIALWVGAAGRPTVIRIAVAIFCACFVQRLLVLIRHAAAIDQAPLADRATMPSVESVTTDPLLTDLAKDLRWGGWYFVPPALWMRHYQVFWLPRPWPLWMSAIEPDRRPVNLPASIGVLAIMAAAGLAAMSAVRAEPKHVVS